MNNLMFFKNKPVEVFQWNGQVLFNPYHCGACLDLTESAVRNHLSNMNSKQAVLLKNSDVQDKDIRKLNNAGEKFLTESGVYKLIFKSHKEEAERFQDWVTDEVLPQIRKTGGYLGTNESMTDEEIMAKALMVAQNTINKKNELLKAKEKELLETKEDLNSKNKFINQIAVSQNSLKVVEVAQIASKNGIKIGQNRLWEKLRSWGMIKKNSKYDPKQEYIERGYFEVVEGTKENSGGVFAYRTTRVLGKGQVYIINKLLEEQKEAI